MEHANGGHEQGGSEDTMDPQVFRMRMEWAHKNGLTGGAGYLDLLDVLPPSAEPDQQIREWLLTMGRGDIVWGIPDPWQSQDEWEEWFRAAAFRVREYRGDYDHLKVAAKSAAIGSVLTTASGPMKVVIGHGSFEGHTYLVPGSPSIHLYANPGETLAGPASLKILDEMRKGAVPQSQVSYPVANTGAMVEIGGGCPVDEGQVVPNMVVSPLLPDERPRAVDTLSNTLGLSGKDKPWVLLVDTDVYLCNGGCSFPDEHTCGGLLDRTRYPDIGSLRFVSCTASRSGSNEMRRDIKGMDSAWIEADKKIVDYLYDLFVTDFANGLLKLHQLTERDRKTANRIREYKAINRMEDVSKCFLSGAEWKSFAALGRERYMFELDKKGKTVFGVMAVQFLSRLIGSGQFEQAARFLNEVEKGDLVACKAVLGQCYADGLLSDDVMTSLVQAGWNI
ncbi:hypothetical protein ACTVZO_39230 [Streptomyces sp. IBSNAI002]|uniref:hypothetical protein n=1 Tax=Streptomyces sp. IBSNAI002 TaxID=3457500 RepID=UPI003FD31089